MPRDATPRWFVDETSLGLGRALALVRGDVLHPGHRRIDDRIPESTKDVDWMPIVAALDLVVISRDRHIRSKQAELEAYVAFGIRAFWIAGDKDMGNWDNLERIVRFWDRMERIVDQRPKGPWFYELHQTKLTEVRVSPRMRPIGPAPTSLAPKPAPRGSQLDLGI